MKRNINHRPRGYPRMDALSWDPFPQPVIDDAIRLHGHLAPGIILGFKMGMHVLELVRPSPGDTVILTSETTRCIPDGLQVMARHLLVNGGYRVYTRTYDVGKLAIQVTVNKKDLYRVVLDEAYVRDHPDLHAWVHLDKGQQLPLEDLRAMMWTVDHRAAFARKPFAKRIKAAVKGKQVEPCPSCGEATSRLSMVRDGDRMTCKTCAFFEP